MNVRRRRRARRKFVGRVRPGTLPFSPAFVNYGNGAGREKLRPGQTLVDTMFARPGRKRPFKVIAKPMGGGGTSAAQAPPNIKLFTVFLKAGVTKGIRIFGPGDSKFGSGYELEINADGVLKKFGGGFDGIALQGAFQGPPSIVEPSGQESIYVHGSVEYVLVQDVEIRMGGSESKNGVRMNLESNLKFTSPSTLMANGGKNIGELAGTFRRCSFIKTGAKMKWGVFSYQTSLEFEDCLVFQQGSQEHFSYQHGFSSKAVEFGLPHVGLSARSVYVDGVGPTTNQFGEVFKVTQRPHISFFWPDTRGPKTFQPGDSETADSPTDTGDHSECAFVPGTVEVLDCVMLRFSGGGVVVQGTVCNVFVKRNLFYPGDLSLNKSKGVLAVGIDRGGDYFLPDGTVGNLVCRNSQFISDKTIKVPGSQGGEEILAGAPNCVAVGEVVIDSNFIFKDFSGGQFASVTLMRVANAALLQLTNNGVYSWSQDQLNFKSFVKFEDMLSPSTAVGQWGGAFPPFFSSNRIKGNNTPEIKAKAATFVDPATGAFPPTVDLNSDPAVLGGGFPASVCFQAVDDETVIGTVTLPGGSDPVSGSAPLNTVADDQDF